MSDGGRSITAKALFDTLREKRGQMQIGGTVPGGYPMFTALLLQDLTDAVTFLLALEMEDGDDRPADSR